MTKIRIVALLAVLLAVFVVPAAAQVGGAKKAAVPKPTSEFDSPMVFYLARGGPDACGPGCSEWIAAEGRIDSAADQRLRSLLARVGRRKLPIFFHSPGGSGTAGIAIGRMLHAREMTAGVSRTTPTVCDGMSESACGALKRRAGLALDASLNPLAACNSACVYAFIGATVREVPPGARLGVHAAKVVLVQVSGRTEPVPKAVLAEHLRARAAEFNAQLRRYVQEMKVDVGLHDLSVRIPHERAHFLTREEIAHFGIDTRGFQEARWLPLEAEPGKVSLLKLIVGTSGTSPNDLRTSVIQVDCLEPRGVRIVYLRGLGSEEPPADRTVGLETGQGSILFKGARTVSKLDALDANSLFEGWFADQPFDFLELAATRETVDLVERDEAGKTTRVTKLSTAGLSQAVPVLRERCDVPSSSTESSAAPHTEIPTRQ
jgi:hypothetical protein